MSAHEGLVDLLSQEYYLSKVLVHLIDDGLHECRRVCRKWHDVCSRLPVKLSLGPESHSPPKLDLFPNAASLKLDGGLESNAGFVQCRLLPCLSELNRIKRLEFSLSEWPSVDLPPRSLENIYPLRSLSLKVQNESVLLAFLGILRSLTELTSLKLSRVRALDVSIDVSPITEVNRLRVLRATPCFLVSRGNAFIFGTQTKLTRLEVLQDPTPSYDARLSLQAIHPHAPNLRSLALNGAYDRELELRDWDTLRRFALLDRLALSEVDTEETDFAGILKDLHGLTSLEMVDLWTPDIAPTLNRVLSMSKLKTLTFRPGLEPDEQAGAVPFANLTQLTRLSWKYCSSLSQLKLLTDIKHLNVTTSHAEQRAELVCALEAISDLQQLSVNSRNGSLLLPSSLLARMRKLEMLRLRGADADPDFYKSLATLPGLSHLRLNFHPEMKTPTSSAFHSEINLLTNLTILSIFVTHPSPDGLIESLAEQRRLKRLRTLRLPFNDVRGELRAQLFSELPSLRRIHVDVDCSPYSW